MYRYKFYFHIRFNEFNFLAMQRNNTLPVARLDNTFVDNARYQLTAREAKVMLFLISKIDPIKQKRLHEQTISVKALERILKEDGKKWGGLYSEMQAFQDRMLSRTISIPSDVKIDGKVFPGKMNWFQYISPVKMEDNSVGMRFLFSEPLQPALLNLKKYVGIEMLEVIPLNSSFSIRMFQVFRAHRNRMAKYQNRSTLRYEIPELKSLLGVEGKYDDFGNFKKRVLNALQHEISKYTSIKVEWKGIRKGRSIQEIEFEFWDKGKSKTKSPNHVKSAIEFETLTYAQIKAFDRLVAYGVNDEIALEILNRVGGSEFTGFEDWYIEEVIRIFENKTEQTKDEAKAGTLVNWFLKLKIFDQGDHFSNIIEKIQVRKKELQSSRPAAWENRLVAKGMTGQEFEEMVNG